MKRTNNQTPTKVNSLSLGDWCLKDENSKPVSNFFPDALSVIKVVGSTDEFVRLKLHFENGESEETIVPLSKLDRIDWSNVNNRCIINSHYKNAKWYIGNIIRASLNTAKRETRYKPEKLGIFHFNETVVFIAGNRVITRSPAAGFESSFELEHLPFRLDIETGLTSNQAFEGMKELISLSPEIGRVLVAHVISGIARSAFREAGFIPCAVLVIVGESGMLKSHYVPHLVQLYNRSDEIRADTRFNSTQRFVEDILYEYSECTVVIDDLHTAEAKGIKKTNEATAEEIIRRISDNTGRGHKEGNALVQKKFSGNVVFIGEYIIGKESTIPRALVVNLTKRPDGKILDKYQRQHPLLVSTFYYFFIQWYVDHFYEICEWINTRLTKFREVAANSNFHGRLNDTRFYLQTAYMIFLEFCKESGFITEQDALDEYRSFDSQLVALIRAQQARFKPDKTELKSVDYLKLIRRLYKKGKFCLADSANTFHPDKHDGLIYYNCLCLRRKNLEKLIRKDFTNIQIDDVIKSLADRQALKQVKDKRTVKISTINKSFGAIRFYAIWLNMLD